MVYLETGKMSWSNTYGFGRCINELVRSGIYDFILCADSQKAYVPYIENKKIIAFHDDSYKEQLENFILHMKKGDIIHFPANTIIVRNIPSYVKVIYTIHDLTPLFFYKHRRRNGNILSDGNAISTKEWEKNVNYSLKRADCVVTVSENTKRDIIHYYGIAEEKIIIIYNGIDEKFRQFSVEKKTAKRKEYGFLEKKVILAIIGGRHKNMVRLILAYYLLELVDRNNDYCMVLLGKISPKIRILTEKLENKGKVFLPGKVSDEELITYYNISDCFVFVSLYEGFGFPLLEALACGTQVVSSNTSSLKELGELHSRQVNPKNVFQIAKAMGEINKRDDSIVHRQIDYAKSFTWNAFNEKHKDVIDSLKSES